jgi:hypothetical protein
VLAAKGDSGCGLEYETSVVAAVVEGAEFDDFVR